MARGHLGSHVARRVAVGHAPAEERALRTVTDGASISSQR
jgi:hypothetical protein